MAKLEDHSWRTLAIKLSSAIDKQAQGHWKGTQMVHQYQDAITHKLNIENGKYIEHIHSSGCPRTDAASED